MSKTQHSYLHLLHNHFVGPGRIVRQITHTPSESFHAAYASGLAPRTIHGQSDESGGWGADSSAEMAEIKAIVEAVERYALGEYTLDSFQCTFKEDEAISARNLGVTEISSKLTWKRLSGANTAKSILAPLDFLHHPIDYRELGRMPATPLNISGVAAHQSIDAALISAALELCEHEALMVAWHRRKTLPTISQEGLDPEVLDWIKALRSFGWQIILKDISLDLAPVAMAVGLGPAGKRALSIGTCSAFSLRYATRKAVSEVFRTALIDEASPKEIRDICKEDVHDMGAHALYYSHPKNLLNIHWLWKGGEKRMATNTLTDGSNRTLEEAWKDWQKDDPIKAERNYLCNLLKQRSISLYYDDITPKAVKESDIPLIVTRALAPEMTRLTVGFGRKPAKTERFLKFLGAERLNENLHPFS